MILDFIAESQNSQFIPNSTFCRYQVRLHVFHLLNCSKTFYRKLKALSYPMLLVWWQELDGLTYHTRLEQSTCTMLQAKSYNKTYSPLNFHNNRITTSQSKMNRFRISTPKNTRYSFSNLILLYTRCVKLADLTTANQWDQWLVTLIYIAWSCLQNNKTNRTYMTRV